MSNKKETVVFATITFLFLLFYFFRIYSGIYKLADSSEYLSTSELIKSGKYFLIISDPHNAEIATKRPFLYPFFLLINSFSNLKFVLFIQTLFGIFNFYIILRCLKKLNITLPYYSVLIVLLTPSIFIYTQLVMSEWLVLTFFMLLLFVFSHEFTFKRFFFIQILTVALTATKPVFFPIIYFNLLYFSIFFYKKKVFSIYLFLPIIFLFSYLKFNNYRTGFTHFSSIENINLIDYNLYYFKSNLENKELADKWKDSIYQEGSKLKTYVAKNEFYKYAALTEIKSNFFQYSWYHFYTSIRGMIDPGRFDLMTFFKQENGQEGLIEILNSNKPFATLLNNKNVWVYIFLVPIFVIQLIKFSCFAFFIYQKKNKLFSYKFYPILVLLLYVFLTGPVNCSRLMMPMQGLLIIITIYQLNTFLQKLKASKLAIKKNHLS